MSTPKGPLVLDQWEIQNKIPHGLCNHLNQEICQLNPYNERIQALIDLIRKKDEVLQFYANGTPFNCHPQMDIKGPAKIALSLTEKLK